LTTGEISAHFADIYGANVSKDTISRITDKVLEEMQAWSNRPRERVYAAVFVDAIMVKVKVRDGQVGNRPVYAAIEVDLDGNKDILGMWAGDGDGESATFWMAVLTDLKNRGVADVFFVLCDRLKGLPNSVNMVWPMATVQTCIIHLVRGSFRYASRKYWDELSKDLRPIYTATGPDAAVARVGLRLGEVADDLPGPGVWVGSPALVGSAPRVVNAGPKLTVRMKASPAAAVLTQILTDPVCQPWVRHPLPDNQ